MNIKVLAGNTASALGFGSEHGLSLYVETKQNNMLFDVGASGLFAENAAKMNPQIVSACERGEIERLNNSWLEKIAETL